MQAVIQERYGGPEALKLVEVERPAPGVGQALVRIHAAAVNAGDWHLMRGQPFPVRLMGFGLLKPKYPILGADIAGRVVATGPNGSGLQPGDAVFADLSGMGRGGFAQYVAADEGLLVGLPANLSFEEAAAVPTAAVTALQALRDRGGIQPGQQVLIHGASGGVGSFALQLARYFSAEVTAVCSARNWERALALGAERVIDYAREDFAAAGSRYDLILAVNGDRSIFHYRRALKPGGRYVMIGGSNKQMVQAMLLGPLLSRFSGQRMGMMLQQPNRADLELIRDLIQAGHLRPQIDRSYPLAETADAVRYVDQGHAQGKVVITMPMLEDD